MKPAEVLEKLLPRWRAKLAGRVSPAQVDAFIRRNRQVLEDLVARALARRKAERGEPPGTADEFAAYDPLVARERPRDAEPDEAILARLMTRVDDLLAEGYREFFVLRNVGVEFVDTRAEAILLRSAGWDPVPLFLDRPAIAVVVAGTTVAVRDSMGGLAIHPDRRGTLNQLHFDLNRAEKQVLEFHEALDIEPDTRERLERFAESLWRQARAA